MNQSMMLSGATCNLAHRGELANAPQTGAQRSAAGAVLRGIGDAGRWFLLAAAAPELLIAEERQLAREMRDHARRDG